MKKCFNPECDLDIIKKKYCSKKCQGQYHYIKNKEKVKSRSRLNYQKNKEKYKSMSRLNYSNNKERHLEYVKKWHLQNPEKAKKSHEKAAKKFRKENRKRFNELMLNNYYQNKDKWNCRSHTWKILNSTKYGKTNPIKRKCKKCNEKENLEIHHETYPENSKEIKKAIAKGKIYYLCRKCHGRRKSHFTSSYSFS